MATNTIMSIQSLHVDDWFIDPHTAVCWYRIHLKLSHHSTTRILCRRYSQFRLLDEAARRVLSEFGGEDGCGLAFPGRRWSVVGLGEGAEAGNDKRCRELDYYLQQLLAYFGGRYEAFWNLPAVCSFFSDNPEEQVRLVGPTDTCLQPDDNVVDWADWEGKLRQAEECKLLFEGGRRHSSSSSIAASHYQKMFTEFSQTVSQLHDTLQQHPNHPDTIKRWERLQVLVIYKDNTLNCSREQSKDDKEYDTNDIIIKRYVQQTSDRLLVQEKQLELISESIERLKGMGVEMGREVEVQNELASELTSLVSNEQARTDASTKRVNLL